MNIKRAIDEDSITILEKGKIIEQGSHLQLLDKQGHYNTLFELQFKK